MITDFEISECNIKDLIKSCSIKTKDNKVYFEADRVYNKQKICDEWIIYDAIGEPSGVGQIFETQCSTNRDKSKKYIIFHDTTTFGEVGMYGSRGIWHSIQEFLQENSHWTLHEKFENNNGLTILKRI